MNTVTKLYVVKRGSDMYTKFNEIEYKYDANDVPLLDFIEIVGCEDIKRVNGWDAYFVNDDGVWLRNRAGEELTIKKTVNGNTNRIEVDLKLEETTDEETISRFCELLGFGAAPALRLYKNCFIKEIDDVIYSYYMAHTEDFKKKGIFIEIEVNKNKVEELGDRCKEKLAQAEDKLREIMTPAQNRLTKSLYEIMKEDS